MERILKLIESIESKYVDNNDYLKKIQVLLESLDNKDDKEKVKTWFEMIINDFELKLFHIEKIIQRLMTEKKLGNSITLVNYYTIWNEIDVFYLKDIKNLESILGKYCDVKLDLPLKNINTTKVCNLAYFIYTRLHDSNKKEMSVERITSLMKHLPKDNSYLIKEVIDDHDSVNHTFQAFIEHEIYDKKDETFDQIFNKLYTRSEVKKLEFIHEKKHDMLILTEKHLTKIIFYGRYLVLEFLNKNYNNLLHQILSHCNPYDIRNIESHGKLGLRWMYSDDIWNGHTWGNDECDRECVGITQKNFKKTFELLNNIAKDYDNVKFTIELKKLWLNNLLWHNAPTREGDYYMSKYELLDELEFNFKSKESIKNMIDLLGIDETWNLIKEQKSNILKLLIE